MKTEPDDLTAADVLDLRSKHMPAPNCEQRGAISTSVQQNKLVDSLPRGYPIPFIYFHHIRQVAGGELVAERFEIIDGFCIEFLDGEALARHLDMAPPQ